MRMRKFRITAVALSALAVFGVSSGVAQAATLLDQSSSTVDSASGVTTGNQYAQLVTAGLSGTLTSVEVSALRIAGTTADLTASIRSVSGGQPSGTDLATASVPYTAVALGAGWVNFNFSSPISITAGDQFAIVVTTTASGASPYSWAYETTSTYTGGVSARKFGAGSWTNEVFGFAFRTYVNTPDSGETPPPVMQQFGMPSTGTCDASAPAVLNWGGAGSGGWGNSWAEWMNGGRGGAVCTRTLVYSNAVGHWIVG